MVPAVLEFSADVPRTLTVHPRLTDVEFEALCLSSDMVGIERTREGEILIHPPTGGKTFFLPDTSVLSPDAAYIPPDTLKGLICDDLTGFPRLCPDFVIELLSQSDSLPKAKVKMERWIENGAAEGWLVDPSKKKVQVYRTGRKATVVSGHFVKGSGPLRDLPSTSTSFDIVMQSDRIRGEWQN